MPFGKWPLCVYNFSLMSLPSDVDAFEISCLCFVSSMPIGLKFAVYGFKIFCLSFEEVDAYFFALLPRSEKKPAYAFS